MPDHPCTEPRIYTILDFYLADTGLLTYHCHYVAAFSMQDAQRRFFAAGLTGTELYIVTDEALDGVRPEVAGVKANVEQARFDSVSPEGHARWVRAMTHGHHADGSYYGPGWTRFHPTTPPVVPAETVLQARQRQMEERRAGFPADEALDTPDAPRAWAGAA